MTKVKTHHKPLLRHSVSVGELTAQFAGALGYSQTDQQRMRDAALLHDIGKLEIPAHLLGKGGELTVREWKMIHSHPEMGHRMLREYGGFDELTLTVALQHHERLDGSGYPNGIRGEQISHEVRIVSICDVFAAMTEERPYTLPLSAEEAVAGMLAKRMRLDQSLVRQFEDMVLR